MWFAYVDEEWVLRDVSLRIEPGETLAVVGHTGAGKTTLTNLLLRFYDVQRGAITIGGIDIREFDARDCGANSGSCCRIRTCSQGRWRRTSGWATRLRPAPSRRPRAR